MIVADASWVVALRDPEDRYHERALMVNRDIGGEDVLLHSVTLTECLVAPARLGVLKVASEALRASFRIVDIDDGAPERWATLRVQFGLRLPDVIVLDTALSHGARAVATFDVRLAAASSQRGLEVLG
ncbi:MAG: type II toxin-antitoxin system VapC family toxin [Acidimicrobiia bacterium]|nr:type II toxin-antitoxin system VapC family toxin [Acidimicrobiia bacterium]MYC57426.1 type II toxin-antitoxin system VapC family toxin [Acidimicrobiia bacterium]MYG93753.1 type II toxin-antitoxin system VapC family toxin [Acidimicrobiia bacterium]